MAFALEARWVDGGRNETKRNRMERMCLRGTPLEAGAKRRGEVAFALEARWVDGGRNRMERMCLRGVPLEAGAKKRGGWLSPWERDRWWERN